MDKYVLRRPKKIRAVQVRMSNLEMLSPLRAIVGIEVLTVNEMNLTMVDGKKVKIKDGMWLLDHGMPIRLSESSGSKDHRRWEPLDGVTFREFYKGE